MAMNYTHTFDKSFGISSKLAFGSAVPLETLIEERIFGSPEKKKKKVFHRSFRLGTDKVCKSKNVHNHKPPAFFVAQAMGDVARTVWGLVSPCIPS